MERLETPQRVVLGVADSVSVVGTAGALIGYLPAATAFVTLLWMLIRIYETKTVKRLLKRLFGREP